MARIKKMAQARWLDLSSMARSQPQLSLIFFQACPEDFASAPVASVFLEPEPELALEAEAAAAAAEEPASAKALDALAAVSACSNVCTYLGSCESFTLQAFLTNCWHCASVAEKVFARGFARIVFAIAT